MRWRSKLAGLGTLFYLNRLLLKISENSPIWAKIFIKRGKILGKFKKGPPHIGEYEENWHFWGGRSPWLFYNHPVTHIRSEYKYKYQNIKAEKYENTSRKIGSLLYIWSFYIILGSVTSWMNIKYTYIIEFKLLLRSG